MLEETTFRWGIIGQEILAFLIYYGLYTFSSLVLLSFFVLTQLYLHPLLQDQLNHPAKVVLEDCVSACVLQSSNFLAMSF